MLALNFWDGQDMGAWGSKGHSRTIGQSFIERVITLKNWSKKVFPP